MSLVVASASEALRATVLGALAEAGYPTRPVADWEGLCAIVAARDTRAVLVDATLPRLDAEILDRFARSTAHAPRISVFGPARPPLARIPATPRAVVRFARQALGYTGLSPEERDELRWAGLGERPLERLAPLAAGEVPIWIVGERGTGKERIARLLHRLGAPNTPFTVVRPGERPEPGSGMLYLEAAHRREPGDIRGLVAGARGRRIIAGSRSAEPPPGMDWARLHISPLRERANDLAALTVHYLDRHARRLGLSGRRCDRALTTAIHAWRWPGNHRELDQFIGTLVTRIQGAVLRARDLPEDLRNQLRPSDRDVTAATEGFEEMALHRLHAVVATYESGPGPSLYTLVVGSAERALIQLVLDRTAGNRKQAAEVLGIARNTLGARMAALGISATPG